MPRGSPNKAAPLQYAEALGDPVRTGRSALIYRYWLNKLGLRGEYRARHVAAGDLLGSLGELRDYLSSARDDRSWLGCNIAGPLDVAAAALVDSLEPMAARLGTVDLVVKAGGKLLGRNTEAACFMKLLWARLGTRSSHRAMMIGTEGSARMIVHALAAAGFKLDIFGREVAPTLRLVKELGEMNGHRVRSLAQEALDQEKYGLLVNATALGVNGMPIGMEGMPPITLRLEELSPGAIVCDTAADPISTPLLNAASRRGFATINGLEMLIGQAAISFEALFGVPAPRRFDHQLELLLIPQARLET